MSLAPACMQYPSTQTNASIPSITTKTLKIIKTLVTYTKKIELLSISPKTKNLNFKLNQLFIQINKEPTLTKQNECKTPYAKASAATALNTLR